MSVKSCAVLFSKVLAIYVFIWCINYMTSLITLPMSLKNAPSWERLNMVLSMLIPLIMQAILGYFLWSRADYLSEKMVGDKYEDKHPVGMEDVQVIAFSTVGVLVLSDAVPELAHQTSFFIFVRQNSNLWASDWSYVSTLTSIAGAVVKLAMGLWLLMGSMGIVRLLGYLRKVGVAKNEPENG